MLFDKIDLSKVDPRLRDALGEGEKALADGLGSLKQQSKPIADSALKTFQLTQSAVEQYAKGEIDAPAVAFVFQEGIKQTVILAHAEGNLLLSASVSFLRSIGGIVLRTGLALVGQK